MSQLHAHKVDWPLDEWKIIDPGFNSKTHEFKETIFAVANGYLGSRGTFDEGTPANTNSCSGTYLNGVYSKHAIEYGESAYGFAKENHQILKVPDGKDIKIFIDEFEFKAQLDHVDNERYLDMSTGILTRVIILKTQNNKLLSVKSNRFASLTHSNLLCTEYEFTPLNFDGHINIQSVLSTEEHNSIESDDPRVAELSLASSLELYSHYNDELSTCLVHKIKNTPQSVASAMLHQSCVNFTVEPQASDENNSKTRLKINVEQGKKYTLSKYLAYADSLDNAQNLQNTVLEYLKKASEIGFKELSQLHTQKIVSFWQQADVKIEGDISLQQAIRFNQLSLFLSVGKDGKRNISAKGITGPGYEGHYFWDSEIYIIPYLTYTQPEYAKSLLLHRYHSLNKARDRAKEMSHDTGALYPWRTIGGEECSAFFPAGTAQYHINAAVAYAVRCYYRATDDFDFICQFGGEMVFETARLWLELGHFSSYKNNQFCIDAVTGPDEYTAVVNNNFYTNAMAKMHLLFAVEIAQLMQNKAPKIYKHLCENIKLDENEITLWFTAADEMYLPHDETLNISPQDDGFLAKKSWDFKNTPKEKYPLLLNFHPLVIYRHKVLKQADVVLAMYLLDEEFDIELKKNNLAYYEPITTHDSTLSTCIHAVEYAETGDSERAFDFFSQTVKMDLDNSHNNTEHGVHTACMAGSWIAIVNGFAGMRVRKTGLFLSPSLPKEWPSFSFLMQFQGKTIEIEICKNDTKYLLKNGSELSLTHFNQKIILKEGIKHIALNQTTGA
ncbi:glycoside hydrolase family 65 protein [Pseudoalteromonas denitrificans]|uniref:glycoside hydrolase family 65 protein n=1 Tax=Pseudoalteromonas denitrificans TaxID=43656 RepID=UPI0015A4F12F|nr:glycoside hydrolase family 65 protein [Pseudoalteromonas denitrificans]